MKKPKDVFATKSKYKKGTLGEYYDKHPEADYFRKRIAYGMNLVYEDFIRKMKKLK